MAEALIPAESATDHFWVQAARVIFSTTAFLMKNDKDRSTQKLLDYLINKDIEQLQEYLKGTGAATLINSKIEKMALSLKAEIAAYLKSLRFLQGLDKENKNKFSIKDWIQNEDTNSWLFISSNAKQHGSLKPLISMWLAMASIHLLSLPEDYNRRIWFVVDEMPTLNRLPYLPETVAEVRKFGGCFVIGMQSYAQLDKTYGRDAAREIFDLLNTRFFFRSPSAEMAKLVSVELGEQEVDDLRENYSYGANTIRDGISIGRQKTTKSIVSFPEIMNMQNLSCYLRLPADYPIVNLNLKYQNRDKITTYFNERKIDYDQNTEKSVAAAPDKDITRLKKNQLKPDFDLVDTRF